MARTAGVAGLTLAFSCLAIPSACGFSASPDISASGDPASKARKKPTKLYWGATIGKQLTGTEAPWDMAPVAKLQRKVRKPLSLIAFAAPFADCNTSPCKFIDFPATPLENARKYGAIPFFSWSSSSTPGGLDQPNFQLSDVIRGEFDPFIRGYAAKAKNYGHPFFLRFNWEMNGDWYGWSERRNGNKRGESVAAWRHVHDIFTAEGATNVTWVWCPNVIIRAAGEPGRTSSSIGRASASTDAAFQSLRSLYPGDRYVDWTCLDGFNWGSHPANPNPWRSFREVFRKTYRKVRRLAPGKPMVIGETASSDHGGSKAAWIRNTLRTIPRNYRKIRGLIWFDVIDRGIDWPIESSRRSVRAFRKGIQSRSYRPNRFGNLGSGPIRPPG